MRALGPRAASRLRQGRTGDGVLQLRVRGLPKEADEAGLRGRLSALGGNLSCGSVNLDRDPITGQATGSGVLHVRATSYGNGPGQATARSAVRSVEAHGFKVVGSG